MLIPAVRRITAAGVRQRSASSGRADIYIPPLAISQFVPPDDRRTQRVGATCVDLSAWRSPE